MLIWPSIYYIGIYDVWIEGVLLWLILQTGLAVIWRIVRGILIDIHFIMACILYPLGYHLSMSIVL
ncbi:hypothetical protein SAMN05421863_11162 [Nitrosomonas communis]|uniref:Uncharacterized protein n=1 Tax=Nitrosomonas communis TaxID=44574 RepID=A0A1I4WQM4_9PROT|nr:hypothetical protein SAMN05421863_11162 [Nitrosomonas communis]